MKFKQVVKLWVFFEGITMVLVAGMHLLHANRGEYFPFKVYPIMFIVITVLIPGAAIVIAALEWWMREDEK